MGLRSRPLADRLGRACGLGGKIVGLGGTGLERNDVAEKSAPKDQLRRKNLFWISGPSPAEQGEQLSLWLIDSKGNACFAASRRFM